MTGLSVADGKSISSVWQSKKKNIRFEHFQSGTSITHNFLCYPLQFFQEQCTKKIHRTPRALYSPTPSSSSSLRFVIFGEQFQPIKSNGCVPMQFVVYFNCIPRETKFAYISPSSCCNRNFNSIQTRVCQDGALCHCILLDIHIYSRNTNTLVQVLNGNTVLLLFPHTVPYNTAIENALTEWVSEWVSVCILWNKWRERIYLLWVGISFCVSGGVGRCVYVYVFE